MGQHIADSDQLVHLVLVSNSGGGARSSSAACQQPQAQAASALRESDQKLAQQLPVQQQTWSVGLWRPKSGQDSRQQVRREGHGPEHVTCDGGCADIATCCFLLRSAQLPFCPAHLPLQLLSLQAGWPAVVSSLLLHPGHIVDLQPDGREPSADGTSRPRLLLSVRRPAGPGGSAGHLAPVAAAAPELAGQAGHLQQQQQQQPARHASIPLVRSFPAVKVETAAAAGARAQAPSAEQPFTASAGLDILPPEPLPPAPVMPQAATAAHNPRLQQLVHPRQLQQHLRPPSQHSAGTEYWH